MRKAYPSDISRKQLEHILPILESARKKTKPRTVDLYDVFCGLLYILREPLPQKLPKEMNCTRLKSYQSDGW